MENTVESIVRALFCLCAKNWERLAFRAICGDTHTEMYFYVKYDGKYYTSEQSALRCGIAEEGLVDTYQTIVLMCEKPKDAQWKGFDLTVESDGCFELSYEYALISDSDWEKKYLV